MLQLSQYDLRTGTPKAVKSQAIVDILTQFPGEEEFPLDLFTQFPSGKKPSYSGSIDTVSRGSSQDKRGQRTMGNKI